MMTVLVALRDALVALALAWVGVSIERSNADAPTPSSAPPTCSSEGGLCGMEKPAFNALDCTDR